MLVTIDYFTKWVETKPLAHITKNKVIEFVSKAIIYHFGVSKVLIISNGQHFIRARFEEFYEE